MLSPKRVKRRKQHRNVSSFTKRDAQRGNTIAFGDCALVTTEPKWITNRQIEAARIAMTRHIRRGGKVWIRVFPDTPYTRKPAETRMGKGKGNPESWVVPVKAGTVLFEIGGIDLEVAREAMRLAGNKLPVKVKFVHRRDME